MKLTPLQKRAERKSRNKTMVDMNLVSLIDVFTILIFFLLSSTSGVELLSSPKAVKLPLSTADKSPKGDSSGRRQRRRHPRRRPQGRVGGRSDGRAGRPRAAAEGRTRIDLCQPP